MRIDSTRFHRVMSSEQDFRPSYSPSTPDNQPDAWCSVRKALAYGAASRRHGFGPHEIVTCARTGQLRSWADLLAVGETRWSGGVIPVRFWEEFRHGPDQDWIKGRFQINVGGRFVVEAGDVSFYLDDLKMLFAKSFRPKPGPKSPSIPAPSPVPERLTVGGQKGGRKQSATWPQWVAELVAYVHESGIPEGEGTAGVDVVLKAVADRLAARGLEGPARSTSQETMRAVLLRLRGAGN